MRILISGAGVGGLALAGFLKGEPDIECVLIDKAKEWHHDGFSIALWQNGRHMLQKLGLGDTFDANAIPFKHLIIRNGAGRVIRDWNFSEFDVEFGMSVAHVSRAGLHEWLLKAAQTPVRMNTTITELTENEDGVDVVLSDGTHEKFDLVVGADGIHSQVRALTTGVGEHFINWRAWWFWCKPEVCAPHTINEYVLPGKFAVLSNEGERALAVFMASSPHGVWDEEAGRIDRLKALFKDAHALVPNIFDGINDHDVMPSDLTDLHLPYWRTARTVLLGDAAHALTPFIALGASMALEDAYVLAGELCQLPRDLERALSNYEQKRVSRIERIRGLNERMRMISAVKASWLRNLINMAMPAVPQKAALHDYLSILRKNL